MLRLCATFISGIGIWCQKQYGPIHYVMIVITFGEIAVSDAQPQVFSSNFCLSLIAFAIILARLLSRVYAKSPLTLKLSLARGYLSLYLMPRERLTSL